MNVRRLPLSRCGSDLSRIGAAVAATMLALGVISAMDSGIRASAAAQNAGALQVLAPPSAANAGQVLLGGGSATKFALSPPIGAACTGDSAAAGYRVQSYIVPASVDPSTLTFNSNGPLPAGTGAALRQPLFAISTPFVNKTTAVAATAGGDGLLVGLPEFSFDVFAPAGAQVVPPGTYNVGYACTLGQASATQLDKYWNVQLTFAADPKDVPAGITFTVVAPTTPTTPTTPAPTTPTTPTTPAPTTPTTPAPTTPAPTTPTTSTSTTVAATTTSTIAGTGSGTTTTVKFGSSSTASTASTVQNGVGAVPITTKLATTGSSPLPIVVWAILLLVFGRMIILLGRPSTGSQRKSR